MRPWAASVVLLFWLPSAARASGPTAVTCADEYVKGQQLRNGHRLVEARDALRVCAAFPCKDFMVRDCSEWLDDVKKRIPMVTPVATDSDGRALSGVEVSVDGVSPVAAGDGRAIEVDPGAHTFTFELPDGRTLSTSALVEEGDRGARVSVTFGRFMNVSAPGVEPAASPGPVVARTPPDLGHAAGASSSFPWKTIGLAVGGLGILGVGAGAFFGIDALTRRSKAGCDDDNPCATSDRQSQLEAARRSGNLSTAFFVAGGVLGASGLVLWILAPGGSLAVSASGGRTGSLTLAARGAW